MALPERFNKGGPMPKSVGACADLYTEVRELRLAMDKAVKAVKERETEIYNMILSTLQESPDSGAAGDTTSVRMTEKEVFHAKSWDQIFPWVASKNQFQLLGKSLNNKAIRELYEEYGQLPPGVERDEIEQLSFTKV